ncbi:MAG: DUF192 domain-containing protein [Thermoleophilia bacterium]
MLRVDQLTGAPAPLQADGAAMVAARCHLADGVLSRLVGLLCTPDLRAEEALWITRCASVHTFALRAPIGVAFVDRDGVVLRVVDPLPAWRAAGARGAVAAVELRAGVLRDAGVAPGTRLSRRA